MNRKERKQLLIERSARLNHNKLAAHSSLIHEMLDDGFNCVGIAEYLLSAHEVSVTARAIQIFRKKHRSDAPSDRRTRRDEGSASDSAANSRLIREACEEPRTPGRREERRKGAKVMRNRVSDERLGAQHFTNRAPSAPTIESDKSKKEPPGLAAAVVIDHAQPDRPADALSGGGAAPPTNSGDLRMEPSECVEPSHSLAGLQPLNTKVEQDGASFHPGRGPDEPYSRLEGSPPLDSASLSSAAAGAQAIEKKRRPFVYDPNTAEEVAKIEAFKSDRARGRKADRRTRRNNGASTKE